MSVGCHREALWRRTGCGCVGASWSYPDSDPIDSSRESNLRVVSLKCSLDMTDGSRPAVFPETAALLRVSAALRLRPILRSAASTARG